MRTRPLSLAAAACTLLLTGCGTGPIQEEQIQRVFDDYVQAVNDKDGVRFCDSVASPEFIGMSKDERAKEIKLCKDDFSSKDFGGGYAPLRETELTQITVKGKRATASLKGSKQSAKPRFLSVDGEWKVLFESR